MSRLIRISAFLLLSAAGFAQAQQSRAFGDYVVHYNALSTSQLTPQVAQSYGIQRSPSRALLNITVLRYAADGGEAPVRATVEATAKNLTGQLREITMREITDVEDAVYYIGELRVHNLETFDFSVSVLPAGENEALEVKFRQQFFTE
jgi:hypothetical protein